MDNNINNSDIKKKIEKGSLDVQDLTTQTPVAPKSKSKKKSSNEEYKRKYFEYYDDIKISDRQDW